MRSQIEGGAMRVLIDARVRPGEQGGVQQALIGLCAGLSRLDGQEQYDFLIEGDGAWLRPYVAGACTVVQARFPDPRTRRIIAGATRVRPQVGVAMRYLMETRGRVLPAADPAVAESRPDVIHFMRHRGWRTSRPNIYVPHDVQHIDLPHLFSPATRTYRRLVYGAMASQATKVAALTSRQIPQFTSCYGVADRDVVVIPWASVLSLYPAAEALPADVPDRFILFPARTWPHKNHLLLIDAIGRLRREGTDVPLVLTGGRDGHWAAVEQRIHDVGAEDLIVHLGFVDDATMRTLYHAADALVFPSTYEGFGLPVVEALDAGTPVVCADIPPLDELVGDAGRLFDPHDAGSIAAAVSSVWSSAAQREAMVERGRQRMSGLSWEATAIRYRALYRLLAGVDTDEDRTVLARRPFV